ncbi:MAG: CarD family transcriptional regulator, partial [Clostridia bacterium]|nr:CarD family transcriptional regulator [Clostridia bacterium]
MAKLDHRQLGFLFEPLEELESFRALKSALETCGIYGAYGLDDSQRAHVLAGLARASGRPLLVLTATETGAQRMTEDLNALLGDTVHLPAREISFLRTAASSRDIAVRRLEALGKAVSGQLKAVVCAVDAAMYRLLPAAQFHTHVLRVEEGMVLEPGDMIARLTQIGYERVQLVEARGQCALRGGILDVYPVGGVSALRLEFFDDEVDSIRQFDVMTQRSVTRVQRADIFPASEIVLEPEQAAEIADRLEALLVPDADQPKQPAQDRQRQLEQEFDLIPFEQFFAMDDAGDEDALPDFGSLQVAPVTKAPEARISDEARRALPARNAKEKYFRQVLDALRSGINTDALNALLTVLLPESQRIEDYLDDPIVVLDQPERLRERADNHRLEFIEHFKTALERDEALPVQENLLLGFDELAESFRRRCVLTLNPFMRTSEDFKPQGIFKFEGRGATAYGGNVRELALDLKNWVEDGWRIVLLSGGVARGQRLEKALENQAVYASFSESAPDVLEPQEIIILPAGLNRGFLYAENKLAVITESDVFGVNKQKSRAKASSGEKLAAFTDLNVGDYVVHENHGIGQYMGTVRLSSEGTYRDFLHIRYLGSDKLYVPVDQLDRVQKYIGSEGEIPRMNRLSGGEWQKQKAKVKASIRDIADDLIKLYADRQAATGFAFSPDTPWQREFEDAFPYEETPDQLTAIEDIKRDMESNRVMDRLLCGDVGYGKTEVALRAIFKCIMDNKQAVLLAPTTILVQQHYQTITSRFSGFPVRIEMLSRFKSATEQKRIIKKLADGEVDIVIGTHRLLNKDVKFKDLGLLVVDEEQRFGVVHKEAIKKLKRSVDVLTLSATPIPRTLHMSMVGIRDMSILQTPPEERYPVQTYVVEYSDGLVRDAILRELQRGGQVYVLHNRVQTIEAMYARLKKLVPEAR